MLGVLGCIMGYAGVRAGGGPCFGVLHACDPSENSVTRRVLVDEESAAVRGHTVVVVERYLIAYHQA